MTHKLTFSCDDEVELIRPKAIKKIHGSRDLHELMVNVSKHLLTAGLAQLELCKGNLTSSLYVSY